MHTTYKTGGPADIYYVPADAEELIRILKAVNHLDIPKFIIGGGANLLVSDKGLRGLVIDTHKMNSLHVTGHTHIRCGAGAVVDKASEAALRAGLAGLDSFYGMPGTIGGAVWMNARCYGKSISDLLVSVKYIDSVDNEIRTLKTSEMEFDYKKSIFQRKNWIIIEAEFQLYPGLIDEIQKNMDENRADRKNKGHYAGPSAGSVFKNNRAFGKPSGSIIDSLNLRGSRSGGAVISKDHANIFLNAGNATSSDILSLIKLTQKKVFDAYGFELEPEVQLLGDFSNQT